MNIFLSAVFAQTINNPVLGDLGSLSGSEFFGRLIPALLSLALVIGAIIFLFYFLLGAINWITSGGDKMKIERARDRISAALVGLIILFSFIAIIDLIECFFGIGLREVTLGPFQVNFSNVPICTSGSGGDENNPIEIPIATATPIPTATATPIPTATSTPTPTPTPGCVPPCTTVPEEWFCSIVGELPPACCRCVYGNCGDETGPVTCCQPPGPSSGFCDTYDVPTCCPS